MQAHASFLDAYSTEHQMEVPLPCNGYRISRNLKLCMPYLCDFDYRCKDMTLFVTIGNVKIGR